MINKKFHQRLLMFKVIIKLFQFILVVACTWMLYNHIITEWIDKLFAPVLHRVSINKSPRIQSGPILLKTPRHVDQLWQMDLKHLWTPASGRLKLNKISVAEMYNNAFNISQGGKFIKRHFSQPLPFANQVWKMSNVWLIDFRNKKKCF